MIVSTRQLLTEEIGKVARVPENKVGVRFFGAKTHHMILSTPSVVYTRESVDDILTQIIFALHTYDGYVHTEDLFLHSMPLSPSLLKSNFEKARKIVIAENRGLSLISLRNPLIKGMINMCASLFNVAKLHIESDSNAQDIFTTILSIAEKRQNRAPAIDPFHEHFLVMVDSELKNMNITEEILTEYEAWAPTTKDRYLMSEYSK